MLMQTLRRVQPFFVLLALLFMAFLLHSQWEELQTHQWQLNPLGLGTSAVFLVAAWAVEIVVWLRLLRTVGGDLGYWSGARIWFLSAIVRYIPGNVWQPLSMTLLCQRLGVKPEATVTSILLYQVVTLLAVTPVAALYFGVTGNWGLLTGFLAGYGSGLLGLLWCRSSPLSFVQVCSSNSSTGYWCALDAACSTRGFRAPNSFWSWL